MLLRAVVIGRQLLYALDHAYFSQQIKINHGFEDSQPSRTRANMFIPINFPIQLNLSVQVHFTLLIF